MRKPLLLSLLLLASCTLQARIAEAIFAGGNFWRLEADFNSLPGVLATVTGFDGGNTPNPTYEQVNSGKTGYTQAVRVIYNPDQISYKNLLRFYWHRIDPTEKNGQFCDAGHQYKSAIFYLNDKQKKAAFESRNELKNKFPVIFTDILSTTQFYAASGEHQSFYQKHSFRYRWYLYRCAQEDRLQQLWGGKY